MSDIADVLGKHIITRLTQCLYIVNPINPANPYIIKALRQNYTKRNIYHFYAILNRNDYVTIKYWTQVYDFEKNVNGSKGIKLNIHERCIEWTDPDILNLLDIYIEPKNKNWEP